MAEGNGKLSKEALAELRSRHGDLLTFSTDLGDVALSRPGQAVWDRWVEQAADDAKSKAIAMRQLVLGCLVYPEQQYVEQIFAKYPGLPSALSAKLSVFAGAGEAFEIREVKNE